MGRWGRVAWMQGCSGFRVRAVLLIHYFTLVFRSPSGRGVRDGRRKSTLFLLGVPRASLRYSPLTLCRAPFAVRL